MLKNIYSPTAGALAMEKTLEVIANNLANVNTTGFKGDQVSFRMLEPEPVKNYKNPIPPAKFKMDMHELLPLRGNDMGYVGVAEVSRDLSQGPAQETGNPADLMIEGKGFFEVKTAEGLRYSRSGALGLGPQGVLQTKAGDPVLGEKGLIYLRSGQFEVSPRGDVIQNKQIVDRIKVVDIPDQDLERVGLNYFHFGGAPENLKSIPMPRLAQGFLEGSNVSAIKNLTAMISAHRSYEAYQKAVQNFDQMMSKSSNQIAELS